MNKKIIYFVTMAVAGIVLQGTARTETRWSDCSECGGIGIVKCSVCDGEGWTPILDETPGLIDASVAVVGSVLQVATAVLETTLTGETETMDHIGHYPCLICNQCGCVTCCACGGSGQIGRTVHIPDPQPPRHCADSNYRRVIQSVAVIHAYGGGYYWSGTGFVARDGGSVYLYTNRHIVMHDGKCADAIRAEFVDGGYINLTPNSFRAANDGRDVVRFLVGGCDQRALTIYSNGPTQGERVLVYGNSLGRGVITEAKGRILGVGLDGLMEHDCDTAQGNSGSPILDVNLQVVGIDTMSCCDKPNEGTVLDDSRYYRVRNFGTSIVGIAWN